MRPLAPFAHTPDSLRRIRSAVLAAALTCAVIASGVPATAETGRTLPSGFTLHDDETVYVVADALGAPRETVVVSWLRLEGNGTVDVHDPGDVQAAEALEDDLEPRVGPEGVTWTLDVEGRRDFFYRVDTRAELPVTVSAAYFLDGEEVRPDDLAGADGRVRIEVTIENTLGVTEDVTYVDADGLPRTRQAEYWVPMLAPVMIELDGRRFSDIESDAQIVNVSGSTVSHTFMAFPQPSTTVAIEMTGTDIAIEPIVVSVYPMMADTPDFSAAKQLAELRTGLDGLSRLSDGHRQALGAMADTIDPDKLAGVEQAAADFERLAAGAGELGEGTTALAGLLDAQIRYLDGVVGQLGSRDVGDVAAIPAAIGQAAAGVGGVRDGVAGLVALADGQIAALDAIVASNAALEADARALAAASAGEAQASVEEIADGLAAQSRMLSALRDGDSALGMPLGLADTRDSLAELSPGLATTAAGLDALAAGSAGLTALPGQLEGLEAALVTLRDGGAVPGGARLPGLRDTRDGLRQTARGMGALGAGIDAAAESLAPLAALPAMLEEMRSALLAVRDGGELQGTYLPGIAMTSGSLKAISGELGTGIADSNYGEAVVAAMERRAAEYDTFLGKPDGAMGSVRFIFKLDGVGVSED